MRRAVSICWVLTGAIVVFGCSGSLERESEQLVRRYNDRLIEAYRSGDAQLMEGLVGDREAMKLTGLIGVKLDMGITLDATLLALDILGVQKHRDSVFVLTEERWHYRDRRIGSGEVVGLESRDSYHMRYVLLEKNGRWVVDEVRFESEPNVGRARSVESQPPQESHPLTADSATGNQAESESVEVKR